MSSLAPQRPATATRRLEHAMNRFAPIGLEDLVDEAALLTRVDRKYVVPVAEVAALLAQVPAGTRALEIDGLRVFAYRSTYLDTPDLAAYHAAGRGRRRRFKVRSRSYLDTGTSWLEVKTRGSRGTTVKSRIPHPDLEDEPLSRTGLDFIDEALTLGRVHGVDAADLRPVIVTAYQRGTLLLPPTEDGTVGRVTIDVDLGWTGLRDDHELDFDRPGVAIVETKTGSTPSAVDRLLWRRGHRPADISKFAVGLAAIDPDLPRLKWTRTLRRDLDVRPNPLQEIR